MSKANVERREVRGVDWAYRVCGHGDRVAVLLHGWPDDGRVWRHQAAALVAAGYRVVAPDLIGFGASDRPEQIDRYHAAKLADDVMTLLRGVHQGPFHLVGHDWGAVVGWEIAARHAEDLRSFTAISVGHMGAVAALDHQALSGLWYFLLAQTEAALDIFRAADGAFMRFFLASHPDVDAIVDRMVAEPDLLAAMRRIELAHPVGDLLLQALTEHATAPATIQTPTLAIWGVDEQLMLEPQLERSSHFVDAAWRFVRIENAGHWVMLERPAVVNSELLGWLGEHDV